MANWQGSNLTAGHTDERGLLKNFSQREMCLLTSCTSLYDDYFRL